MNRRLSHGSFNTPQSARKGPNERRLSATTVDAAKLSEGPGLSSSSVSPSAVSSTSLSPRYPERPPSQLRNAPPSGSVPTPRRSPSSGSLSDDHRMSTPGLQKRLSVSSLRSVQTSGGARVSSPHPSLSGKRSVSNLKSSPSMANLRSKSHPVPEEPTASSIAAEYFGKEIALHSSADLQSKTLVVIQDACYGHRFSRPRASKVALGNIVERPERIRAAVLGLSTAYVRMARRHAGETFAPHPDLDLSLLPVPPFQIRKTDRSLALSSPAVTHVHGTKWMEDLKAMCEAAESRLALNGKELVRPQSAGKDANAPQLHEGDLYLCSESLSAFEGALGGVCEGVDAVFGSGSTQRAFVCIRPPGHHCSSGHPSGFCWINNVHVGIVHAAMTHGLTHAAIIDFDLHHGDGSQAIAWEQNRKAVSSPKNAAQHKKTAIGYFSLHDINSYPCETGDEEKVRNASVCIDNAHGQSTWNVHLEPWKTPVEFWKLYNDKYSILIEKARAFLRSHTERLSSTPNGPPPKAAIFISAGFDASEWEGTGMQRHKVNVPTDFYAKFTTDIVQLAEEEGLGVDGRVISVLEGGYSDRALTSGVFSHLSGLADTRSNASIVDDSQKSRLASEMIGRLGLPETTHQLDTVDEVVAFDTEWWAPAQLDELEALVNHIPPPPKPREKGGHSYFAPTQASTAKAVTQTRDRRSGSHAGADIYIPPPLPQVDWATASYELSKVLIPSDRQTTSHRPEDLNAEATRARRERQSGAEVAEDPVATDGRRMQLRERKPKASLPPTRPSPRNSRRRTITGADDLSGPSPGKSPGNGASPASRRQSATGGAAGQPASRAPSRMASNRQQMPPRPGTVMSTHSSATVSTRNARTPSGSNGSTSKRSNSPKRAPSVSKVPSFHLDPSSAAPAIEEEQPRTDSAPSQSRPLSANEDTQNDDMENLTAGVRKLHIKLKVPSPEENAAREEERRKAASRFPKKSTGSRPTKGAASKSATKTSNQPQRAVLDHSTEQKRGRPVSASISVVSGTGTEALTPNSQADSSSVRPVQRSVSATVSPPLTPGIPQDLVHAQISIQSPPASAEQAKQDLPVFTSTGPVPFASPASPRGHEPPQ
ncbi:hypothetical protein VTN02DRAFT_5320 [Thermoascus thermophilus]